MAYKRLFILVEGLDDERFFEYALKQHFDKKYDHVQITRYAHMKNEKIRNLLKSIKAMHSDYLFVADINNSPCITIKKDELKSVYQERLADSLKELSEYADSKGVKLVLEPINHFEVNSFLRVEQSLEFLHKYNLNKIELLIDTFHMNIEEASMEEAIKMAGTKIGHVHITDSNGRAPGDGHLDYKHILKVIKDTGYNGFLSTEAFPIPSPYECGRRGIKYLKKILSDTEL